MGCSPFLNSENKKDFRQNHSAEITAYEEARNWIKTHYDNQKLQPLSTLKAKKSQLQESIKEEQKLLYSQQQLCHDLEIANKNVSEILTNKNILKRDTFNL